MEIIKDTELFIEMNCKLKIRHEDVDEIVNKATEEGGSLHWVFDYKHSKQLLSKGGLLLLYDMDDKVYKLNKEKLLLGILQALPYLTKPISKGILNIDSIDVDTADFIVQLGLFNELIYD